MRLVIQRVMNASVRVDNKLISEIGPGILILLGISKEDNIETTHKWAQKALNIRLWSEIQKEEENNANIQQQEQQEEQKQELDEEGKPKVHFCKAENLWRTNVMQNNFEVLVVSQFTLYGHVKKGNKPDFHASMGAEGAKYLYEEFIKKMQQLYIPERIKGGAFQQKMAVSLCNDGPVTLTLEGVEEAKPVKTKQQPQKQQQQQQKQQKQSKGDKNKNNNKDEKDQQNQQQQKQEKQEEQKKEEQQK